MTTPTHRIGLVDMGSNAIRTQIAELDPVSGELRNLVEHRAPVRLGRDVFLTGRVPELMIEAAVDVLTRFRAACDAHGVQTIEAIATAAMRDADNQGEVLERIRAATGIRVRVVPGSEEAFLLNRAVRNRIDLSSGRALLVDLGGGSVEVSLLDAGEVLHADSYRLGALRVLQALESSEGGDDAPGEQGASFLRLLDDYVRAVEGRIRDNFGEVRIDRYVATGGNIDSLASLIQVHDPTSYGEIDGVPAVHLTALKDLTGELAQLSYRERIEHYGLRPDRADTILPAAVVYYRIGRAARARDVLVPGVGLRDGMLQEVASRLMRRAGRGDARQTALLGAARAMGRRYRFDERHAEAVRRLALDLFDATRELHELGEDQRLLLEAAALLHDIGVFVNNAKHHKHTWYLIRNSELVGLSDEDRELVALVARYHRRAHPTRKHWGWAGLTAEAQHRVHHLAAILRLADGLDRGHQDKIDHVEVEISSSVLTIHPRLRPDCHSDLGLERLGLDDKSRLFQEVTGRRVRLAEPRAAEATDPHPAEHTGD